MRMLPPLPFPCSLSPFPFPLFPLTLASQPYGTNTYIFTAMLTILESARAENHRCMPVCKQTWLLYLRLCSLNIFGANMHVNGKNTNGSLVLQGLWTRPPPAFSYTPTPVGGTRGRRGRSPWRVGPWLASTERSEDITWAIFVPDLPFV